MYSFAVVFVGGSYHPSSSTPRAARLYSDGLLAAVGACARQADQSEDGISSGCPEL